MRLPGIIRRNLPLAALLLATAAFATFLLVAVIWPAYQKPSNRTYNSRFGYDALRRAMGKPLAVQAASVQLRTIVVRQLGEGRITAMPIRVPLVPMEKVLSVVVAEGDRVTKGQLLAELDATQAQLRVVSAKLLVENAQAELERVKLGSAYTLTQERPEREGINLEASRKQIEILRERHASMETLFKQGAASRIQLLEVESKLAEAERDLQSSQLGLDVSSKGQPQSTAIAENNLKQQQNLLQQRVRELEDYQVRALADGLLESVLIHPGEYNQRAGEVGFVIASGLWFEAHLDQTGIHKVGLKNKAKIQLEALGGEPIEGTIARIVPIVTYGSGGPEASRPVRAFGTGAPEWPTTFSVIVEFAPELCGRLAPGLTGFAKIETEHQALAVPLSAVTTLSNRQGIVNVVLDGKKPSPRKVTLGDVWQGWIEVKDGLAATDSVTVTDGDDMQPVERFKETAAAR
jgi:multidrug efflux pump subunit AcrA (membrane-fusion protein)